MDERIIRVVRGIDRWTVLRPLGVMLEKREQGWKWTIPAFSGTPFEVAVEDLAAGMNAWQEDGEALREWAGYLLADTSYVSFDELQNRPNGDEIVDALWGLTFGEDAAETLRNLVGA
jgi:hypothetical protein